MARCGVERQGFQGKDSDMKTDEATAIGPEVTNGALETIEFSQPYTVDVTIEGTADLLFHRWNCEVDADCDGMS
jgi:hypothetical protein